MKLKEIENYQKLSQPGLTPGDFDAKSNTTVFEYEMNLIFIFFFIKVILFIDKLIYF